jgi:3,4-dihydroxy 2-butanone 4-phosphate synthase/GTP cyclohydrolase II
MNDDGTMARLPDLVDFAKKHDLKVATIADLIAYRRKVDNLVGCIEETTVDSEYGGEFTLKVYEVKDDNAQHFALIKGNPKKDQPTLVRMHPFNMFDDLLSAKGDRRSQLHRAMAEIGAEGCGVIVYLRESSKTIITDQIGRREGKKNLSSETFLRNYGIGAQILVDLGVSDLILLSNTEQHVVGIEGYGLNIVEQRKFNPSFEIGLIKK